MLTKIEIADRKKRNHQNPFCTFFIYIMIEAWPSLEKISSIRHFFSSSILFPKIREKVLTSVDTFCCRRPSGVQSPGVADRTVLKSNISAFRKVLRHQNRFSSRRERSKNAKFDGFWTKSTLALQIRLISMISSRQATKTLRPKTTRLL